MILNRKFILSAAILTAAGLFASHQAEAAFYHFDISTGALTNDPGNPFSLDFTLTSGGTFSNTITLSNFVFTGGTALGGATTLHNASGSLGGTITLTSGANELNDIYQQFSNGTTDIQFDLNTTTVTGGTPDNFYVSILDNTTSPIFTTDPAGTLAQLEIHTNTGVDPIIVSTFPSVAPSPTGVTATVVPEPASSAGLIGGLGMLLAYRRKRRAA